jgi:cytochrome c556
VNRVLCAFGVVLLVSGSTSLGHEGATGIVKQRMDEMEKIGRIMKRINERLNSKRGLGEIAHDAEEIRMMAVRMPSLFPQGSLDNHTEARTAVWERWPEFTQIAQQLQDQARKLATTARSGTEAEVAAQFRTMSRTCSNCHEAFRSKR